MTKSELHNLLAISEQVDKTLLEYYRKGTTAIQEIEEQAQANGGELSPALMLRHENLCYITDKIHKRAEEQAKAYALA